ncbi:hypothetical protein P0W64_11980 [Tsukamurella sp. 8F]|uniref:hypothetical protein n=1 Tax=unclassified Tsukamurella TaxID=2633480 RepID=UPI0023B9B219|nr:MULTISPECIES: hypothetical protein [unclassified Tsukamurella]MDF0531445.1 hypothetical protein [Tsukamurella sp. 8J]MDF0587492.1 hypothetical protein [Tsukamurella sp. 8F]
MHRMTRVAAATATALLLLPLTPAAAAPAPPDPNKVVIQPSDVPAGYRYVRATVGFADKTWIPGHPECQAALDRYTARGKQARRAAASAIRVGDSGTSISMMVDDFDFLSAMGEATRSCLTDTPHPTATPTPTATATARPEMPRTAAVAVPADLARYGMKVTRSTSAKYTSMSTLAPIAVRGDYITATASSTSGADVTAAYWQVLRRQIQRIEAG